MSRTDKVEEVGRSADCRLNSKFDLVEHDYIGLSGTSLPPESRNTELFCSSAYDQPQRKDDKLKCEDTELRLGIGTVYGDVSPSSDASTSMSHNESHEATRHLLKNSGTGLNGLFLRGGDGDSPAHATTEVEQGFVPRTAPGMSTPPVPEVAAFANKRPCIELVNSGCVDDTSPASGLLTKPVLQSVGSQLSAVTTYGLDGPYTWSNSSCCTNVQSSPKPSATYAKPSMFADRHLPVASSVFKVPPTPPEIHHGSLSPSSPLPLCPSSLPCAKRVSVSCRNDLDRVRTSKSSVVGWPPVRSFRKGTLLAGNALASKASFDVPTCEDANRKTLEGGSELKKVNDRDNLYVKAKLDGVRICRKVDVAAFDNYEGLKSALQEMFKGFVSNGNPPLDLPQGENYVLTHKDKDGDSMLVGDVPWRMFVTNVQSLRIMRAVDAVGLGNPVQLNT